MMTNVLLGRLCLGQAAIALILLTILGKIVHGNERADKMLLVCQELADRIWERVAGGEDGG